MRRTVAPIIASWLLLTAALAGAWQASAQMVLMGVGSSKAAASYTGPGNIVANALVWYGLRAYSAATAGTPAINVCNAADATCTDMSTNAAGNLVVTTVGGTDCSVSTCTIKTIYDQSGTGTCAGPCNMTQATISKRPVLVVSFSGGRPCTVLTRAAVSAMTATAFTQAQPFTTSTVAQRTGNTTSLNLIGYVGTNGPYVGFAASANTAQISVAGNPVNATANDSVTHRIQGLFNGGAGASKIMVDNSTTTGNVSTNGAATNNGFAGTIAANTLDGNICELGWWAGDNSASFGALDANQKSYYGL